MTSGAISVYWAPGCSSCLRVKEFLNTRGIAFASVNVVSEPGAMDRLAGFGARSVPVIERDGAFVYAQSNADIVEFLGLEEAAEQMLSPEVLAERLDIMLRATLRYLPQVPSHLLHDRYRNFFAPHNLAHHIFRVGEAFNEADRDALDYSYELMMRGTNGAGRADDIAAYGRRVISQLDTWRLQAIPGDFTAPVTTYYGCQSRHELLERTAWHTAQHTRHMQSVLTDNGVAPDGPLRPDDLNGLPLPRNVWSEDETPAESEA